MCHRWASDIFVSVSILCHFRKMPPKKGSGSKRAKRSTSTPANEDISSGGDAGESTEKVDVVALKNQVDNLQKLLAQQSKSTPVVDEVVPSISHTNRQDPPAKKRAKKSSKTPSATMSQDEDVQFLGEVHEEVDPEGQDIGEIPESTAVNPESAIVFQLQKDMAVMKQALIQQNRGTQPSPLVTPCTIAGELEGTLGGDTSYAGDSHCIRDFLVAGTTTEARIKDKIWSNQYVDFAALIPRHEMSPNQPQTVLPGLVFASKPKKLTSFYEWLKAYGVFMAIYLQKFPQDGPHLATYLLRIQSLNNRRPVSYVWRSYDELFRKVRAFSPNLPWHLYNIPVLKDAEDEASEIARAAVRKQGDNRGPGKMGDTQKNLVCFEYNQKGKICRRQPCRYPHVCAKCSAPHPAFMCSAGAPAAAGAPPRGPQAK